MPYQWLPPQHDSQRLQLWPHRALTRQGFVWFMGLTSALFAAPALALLGRPEWWALLPFLVLPVVALWVALRRNGRDREIIEELELAPDHLSLIHRDRRGSREWQANPYWVRPRLHPHDGPVPNYLTLAGGPREVEIGAFLSEDERLVLYRELTARLAALRLAGPAG